MSYIPQNPNGVTVVTSAAPITLPALHFTGSAQPAPALNYEFLTDSTNGWFDAQGYSFISLTIVPSGVTSGTINFESTNDTVNAPNGAIWYLQDSTNIDYSRPSSATLATATLHYEGPIHTRYIRLRVGTAVVGGSVTVIATLRQTPTSFTTTSVGPSQTGIVGTYTNTIGRVSFTNNINFMGYVQFGAIPTVSDISSAVISSNQISNAIQLDTMNPPAASFAVSVAAISGTAPTFDAIIQESFEGTNYFDLYHFERITATGLYTSPVLRISGSWLRYVTNISASSSATVSLMRSPKSTAGTNLRHYYDRTINANTLGSATAAYLIHGATTIHMSVSSGAATSAATIALQCSFDKINWYTATTVTTTANAIAQTVGTYLGKWVRASVSTAGTGQTINYVHLAAVGI